jgi:hypothetical protein
VVDIQLDAETKTKTYKLILYGSHREVTATDNEMHMLGSDRCPNHLKFKEADFPFKAYKEAMLEMKQRRVLHLVQKIKAAQKHIPPL